MFAGIGFDIANNRVNTITMDMPLCEKCVSKYLFDTSGATHVVSPPQRPLPMAQRYLLQRPGSVAQRSRQAARHKGLQTR